MRKKMKDSTFTLILELPKDFKYTLDEVMEDEFKIACNKWDLALNSDYKKNIMNHSKKQVEYKIGNFTKNKWTIDEKIMRVSISTDIPGHVEYELPNNNQKKFAYKIFKTHDEFILTDEPDDKSIDVNEFYDYFLKVIEKWARTAVFYAVASHV